MNRFAVALACAFAASTVPALADPPCVNTFIVQQAVQQQMNNQLQTEAMNLQTAQQQTQGSLALQMQQQAAMQQYLLLQQQMQLIELRNYLQTHKQHKKH